MQTETPASGLRRELSVWEAIGISVALMAPSMAANINPQGIVGTVGRAVPLAFLLATVGVLLVSWTFVRLCQRFNHAGSVYGFVGATMGARSGVVAGWALLGTYGFYGVVTSVASGRFLSGFLDSLGVWKDQPWWTPLVLALLILAGVYTLAVAPARNGTRLLLIVEATTVALIVMVALIVFIKLATGSAPNGNSVDFSVFSIPDGTDTSTIFLGVVFGFLSFAGFEAAATLGEEAKHPRRDIPRAILGTAIFGGVYFVVITAIEVMGFGTSDTGLKEFGASSSLMGDLGTQFVGSWLGDIITLGAAVSAFGCALACAVGASRLLFALSRDGIGPSGLARVSGSRGTPVPATTCVLVGMVVALVGLTVMSAINNASADVTGPNSLDVFFWSGVIGTLILLVAYALATLGAVKLFFFSGTRSVATWEIVIPIAALLVLGYTLFRNVWPIPDAWVGKALPTICVVWLLLAVLLVVVRPELARRAGAKLLVDEGLATGTSPAQERASR